MDKHNRERDLTIDVWISITERERPYYRCVDKHTRETFFPHPDCMECMACSDNVVRAGLTPKYIDKHTLVEMLDYTGRSINRTKFQGIEDNQEILTTIFHPPVPDFGVSRYQVGRVSCLVLLEISGLVYVTVMCRYCLGFL